MRAARTPNGVGCTRSPLSLPRSATALRGPVRGGWAVSVTPWGVRSGLGGPMPATITPVGAGRCRPPPDGMPLGASPDRDARGVVTGGLTGGGGQRFLPVLRSPPGGVGRIDRDDRDGVFGSHRDQPGLEFRGGEAGDQPPEPPASAVPLAGLLPVEVQAFHRDGPHAGPVGPVQQAGEVGRICASRWSADPDRA